MRKLSVKTGLMGLGLALALTKPSGMGLMARTADAAVRGAEGGDALQQMVSGIGAQSDASGFRVLPYLTAPHAEGVTLTWFADAERASSLSVSGPGLAEPLQIEIAATDLSAVLGYSEAEESGREDPRFADMHANANYKYQAVLSALTPGSTYQYTVTLGDSSYAGQFRTAPTADSLEPIRFIVHADSETEPDTREVARDWAVGVQAPNSTGRPQGWLKDGSGRDLYPFTQGDGFANNIAVWSARNPDFVVMPGDLTQGGNYQRAWDEFFRHMAGERDAPLTQIPLLPALGNWENFGALNGGYAPEAVYAARQRFKAYFDKPDNGTPEHRNQYYRIDYGPVTILTLDSSNGEPDGDRTAPSDKDTQSNVSVATYPGDDLADFNPGSAQWIWAQAQLADARAKGQVIFVQFHHSPYSSGTHGAPMTALDDNGNQVPGNSGQAGTPMRVYSPLFEQYGVVAVFSGHSELFERSLVNGIHYFDTGVAGDGMRGPLAEAFATVNNPYNEWMAHRDEPELWSGNRLLAGGKHYGHLEVEVVPEGEGRFAVHFRPVHVFPLINDAMEVTGYERRVYGDAFTQNVTLEAIDGEPVLRETARDGATVQMRSWSPRLPSVEVRVNGVAVNAQVERSAMAEGDAYLHTVTLGRLPADSAIQVQLQQEGAQREISFRTGRFFLSEPLLQLPGADSVYVVWYTAFEGEGHKVEYGDTFENTVLARSERMSRMYEDWQSDMWTYSVDGERSRRYATLEERPVWRHEALVTGLTPGQRVPYRVVSSDGREVRSSESYSLQPIPPAGAPVQILLTSDQQNRATSPATFQKVEETLGPVELVLFAGDYVDTPHRASEWFDRDSLGRPAFFPSLQGYFDQIRPDSQYRGGAVLQHAATLGVIGNHEAPGRFAKHAEGDSLNSVDNDPQPRWYAEKRFEREVAAGNIILPTQPEAAARARAQYIRDWSYEFTAFLEMWNHPQDGPRGEEYWAYRYGDFFIIGMNVSRVWRNWNPGRGKFSETTADLNNPDEWGFGDMFFEYYGVGSEQYQWLLETLESEDFKTAKYRIVMGHQTMFGLGDNSLPVMADPVATIRYTDANGNPQTLQKVWPTDAATWESEIAPLVERGAITEIYYEYPLENDVWINDIEPLLQAHGVHLVHTGHSHLWNRAIVGDLHYIETSNYGNSFGAGYEGWAQRAPWARFPGDARGVFGPDPSDTPRYGDAHGRPPVYPTHANPMQLMADAERPLPFVASNHIGVFTVIDSADGLIKSYAFDSRDPDSAVVLFDAVPLDLSAQPDNPFFAAMNFGGDWQWSDWKGWVYTGALPWVYSVDHGWLHWHTDEDLAPGTHMIEDLALGTLYTEESVYPLLYSYAREGWIYYYEGTTQPRHFYDLNSRSVFSID